MSSHSPRVSIALIGAGPRGASLIERIAANLEILAPDSAATHASTTSAPEQPEHSEHSGHPERPEIDLHVIDDAQSGAGRIWRTDQNRELCMNTLAHAVTLFTEPGSTVAGPVRPGPTLYEWCLLVRRDGFDKRIAAAAQAGFAPAVAADPAFVERVAQIPRAHIETFDSYPVRDDLAADYEGELAHMRPDSHPSRALYGEYLSWCYHRAVASLPAGVRVIRHRARAVGVERADEGRGSRPEPRDIVRLDGGASVAADAVIIATGWMPRDETAGERALASVLAERPELTWVRPASPVEQPLDRITPGSHAIVHGMAWASSTRWRC